MRASCLVLSNPLQLTPYYATFGTDLTSTAGKTQVAAPAAAGTFLILSESTWGNGPGSNPATAYTPTNTGNVLQINPYDGKVYQYVDPALGMPSASGGGITGRLGDKLITAAKYPSFVAFVSGQSGAKIADYSTGACAQRIGLGVLMARAAGLPITGVILSVGINDAIAGTSQANWQAGFSVVKGALRGMGCNAPISVLTTSRINAGSTSAAIAAAQAAVVTGTDVLAGPSVDSMTGANLQSDGWHLTTAGQDAFATLMRDHIIANF